MTYALDTNIIIDFINGESSVLMQFHGAVKSKISMVIPIVVDYEVNRGFYHVKSAYKEDVYNKMRLYCPVLDVDAKVWDKAASIWATLRKAGHSIGDADIIIAAHCLENGFILVTHNSRHFQYISELQLVDWR